MPAPAEPSPLKRPRPSSSSSSNSSSSSSSITAGLRAKSSRQHSRRNDGHRGSPAAKATLKMAELLAIKRELTVIKVQIDGLLDCVDKMDRQRSDYSDCPGREGSVVDSPYRGASSSMENSPVHVLHRQRESPEPGETSDNEQPHYPQYYHQSHHYHRINLHHSDLDDDM